MATPNRSTTQYRQHPYPLNGGTPLLNAARRTHAPQAVVHDPAPIDWLYGTVAALIMVAIVLLTGCATIAPGSNRDASAYSGAFDDRWMQIIEVEPGAVSGFCQRETTFAACARVYADAGAAPPHPSDPTQVPRFTRCLIYIERTPAIDTAARRFLIEHEARHCRGWHHNGE